MTKISLENIDIGYSDMTGNLYIIKVNKSGKITGKKEINIERLKDYIEKHDKLLQERGKPDDKN